MNVGMHPCVMMVIHMIISGHSQMSAYHNYSTFIESTFA